jgi:trypsin-like peptidase
MMIPRLCLASCFCILASALFAQSPPTNNILTRTVMIQSRYGRGSAFSIDVDQREYWITAKHILTGAQHPPYGAITIREAALSILDPDGTRERWLPVTFSIIDPGKDSDIVVLAAPTLLFNNPLPRVGTTDSFMLGTDCEFLGFPYGGGWRATWDFGAVMWMPFVKHCTLSGLPNAGSNSEPRILVLDGINNEGFSGGPVIFRTGAEQKIGAVISGYHTEPADVVSSLTQIGPAKNPHKKVANVNSGFIIAYPIQPAVDAIRKNPIGPSSP